MHLEETLEYRAYLCLANILVNLHSDNLGSDGWYDDRDYYNSRITELFGSDIDRVFYSQSVTGVFGNQRWAFTDYSRGCKGDDLEARLFHDREFDRYYLAHRPTQTFDDKINNVLTGLGMGIPDKFKQAAQLMELVRPEYRDRMVLTGYSLGGGLAAYAATKAPWPVRTIAFDGLGLNRAMLGKGGFSLFGQREVMSDRVRHLDHTVEWFHIERSWVGKINVERHLSSVGRTTQLPLDHVRASRTDAHDFRHIRFGLRQLWNDQGWRESRWR